MQEQTPIQAREIRAIVNRLGVPSREETLADGTRRFTWRVGTRTIVRTKSTLLGSSHDPVDVVAVVDMGIVNRSRDPAGMFLVAARRS
jgi:hypothetical protein